MEVFVAILLLFGAFSLGSATNNDADDYLTGLELTTTANERQGLPGKGVAEGHVVYTKLQDCLANRHFIIYRDLTVPYDNEIEPEPEPEPEPETETTCASDSEETYPDE